MHLLSLPSLLKYIRSPLLFSPRLLLGIFKVHSWISARVDAYIPRPHKNRRLSSIKYSEIILKMTEFNVDDTLVQEPGRAYQCKKISHRH